MTSYFLFASLFALPPQPGDPALAARIPQLLSPEFRRQVLPKLKANVEAGQGDPGYYAMVYDRSFGDAGRKQLYGENLECNNEDPTLHETPIEDEEHVNVRRAQLGLMRIELYARTVIELSPVACPVAR
jgi:hypothetical protein